MITQRVSTKILVALAVSGAVLLAGCSGGSTAQEPQAPAPAAETPTPSLPALAPPVLSIQARQPNQAGAEAFVRYWWDLYSYAIQTNDADALMAQSSPDCNYCTKTRDRLASNTVEGTRRVGGGVTVEGVALEAGNDKTSLVFKTDLKQEASEFVNTAGEVTSTVEAVANPLYVWVLWSGRAWQMRQVSDSVKR